MSTFQYDRDQLLYLCREIVVGIGEIPDPIGDIKPVVLAITNHELAQKLGFKAPPLRYTERISDSGVVQYLFLNEPNGTGESKFWIFTPKTSTEFVPFRLQSEDRHRLVRVMQRWIRAIEGLPEPEVYPADYPIIHSKINRGRRSDPFWRALDRTITAVVNNPAILLQYDAKRYRELKLEKLNCLAAKTGLGQAVWRYSEKRKDKDGELPLRQLHFYFPDSDHKDPLTITIGAHVGPPAVSDSEVDLLVECLRAWRKQRTQQLECFAACIGEDESMDSSTSDSPSSPLDKPGASDSCSDKAIEPKTTTSNWRDVQADLDQLREKGETYTSEAELAKRLGCAQSTIHKAFNPPIKTPGEGIKPDPRDETVMSIANKLNGWKARKASARATGLSDKVLDNVAQDVESAPDAAVDVDTVMAKLIDQADLKERAKLNKLNDDGRRELVKLYHAHALDAEPSPLDSKRRRIVQHKIV